MHVIGAAQFICAFVALLYGFFGVTCLIAPHFLWGPESLFAYWEEMDESGTWFCRMMANAMLWMVLGPFVFGVDMVKACQVYLVWGALGLVLFVQAAFFLDTSGPGHNALLPLSLWNALGDSWNHWVTIPATFVIAFFLFGIEETGIQLEEPFSILPLEAMCNGAIEATNKEMLRAEEDKVFDS